MRNKLVHRVRAERTLSPDDVTQYVDDVRDAIAHLFSLSDELEPLSQRVQRYEQVPLPSGDVLVPDEFRAIDPVRELTERLRSELHGAGFMPVVVYATDESEVEVTLMGPDPSDDGHVDWVIAEFQVPFEDAFNSVAVKRLAIRLRTAWLNTKGVTGD